MKSVLRLKVHLFFALAAIVTARGGDSPDYGTISSAVAKVLVEGHYSGQRLNTENSPQFLANYLYDLDPDHLYFTQADIDAITQTHADTIGGEVLAGKTEAAFEIFDLYKKRFTARMDKVDTLLKASFDFASNRSVELSRERSPWPSDEAQADQFWRDQIEGELLEEKLNGTPLAECVKIVADRYAEARTELLQQSRDAVLAIFLNSLARTYDPHSEYLRKEDIDDLDSDMRLSMVGIGVVVESDGRYARIVSVLPGSPAALDGRIKVNDRIVAIAKGDGSFVDTAGLALDHVLDLMRSKTGTRIRLKVAASRGGDSERRDVDLVSRPIELVDDEAKGEVIVRQREDGRKERLGWITLPSFYGDPDHPHGKSVTRDVRSLVNQLKKENVEGIVIDLRNNPGGELNEAVGVGGLFLGASPIVQEKDRNGEIYVSTAEGKAIYDGPLVVLTDHMTASAAELLASALQDYGRAVIVGGHYSTYGKGSVQTVVDLGDVIQGLKNVDTDQLGAVQLTIAKFYRVNGQSTQLRGLTADIQLPSPEDLPDDGESSMKNPMAYDEAKPVHITTAAPGHILPIAQLKERSVSRIAADLEFRYLSEDLERERKKDEVNLLSLNESVRRAELDAGQSRDKQREAERKQRKPQDDLVTYIRPQLRGKTGATAISPVANKQSSTAGSENASGASAKSPDEMRVETLNILSDLVRFAAPKNAAPADHVAQNTSTKLDPGVKTP